MGSSPTTALAPPRERVADEAVPVRADPAIGDKKRARGDLARIGSDVADMDVQRAAMRESTSGRLIDQAVKLHGATWSWRSLPDALDMLCVPVTRAGRTSGIQRLVQ